MPATCGEQRPEGQEVGEGVSGGKEERLDRQERRSNPLQAGPGVASERPRPGKPAYPCLGRYSGTDGIQWHRMDPRNLAKA